MPPFVVGEIALVNRGSRARRGSTDVVLIGGGGVGVLAFTAVCARCWNSLRCVSSSPFNAEGGNLLGNDGASALVGPCVRVMYTHAAATAGAPMSAFAWLRDLA